MSRSKKSGLSLISLAACLAAVFGTPAQAGSFSVSPVRIFMEARERPTGVTIINEGDTDLVMQAELFEWKQKPDGTDELLPTQDLVLAPPILKLAKGTQQEVRVSGPSASNHSNLLKNAALAGAGIARLPSYLLQAELADGRLRWLLRDFQTRRMPMYLVHPYQGGLPKRTQVLADYLIGWFKLSGEALDRL